MSLGRLGDTHGFHEQHEIRCGNLLHKLVFDVRHVGTRVGVVPAHLGPKPFELPSPAAILVVRHQGHEHRHHGLRRFGKRLPGELARQLGGDGCRTDRLNPRQRHDRLDTGPVAGQPGANQRARRTLDDDIQGLQLGAMSDGRESGPRRIQPKDQSRSADAA